MRADKNVIFMHPSPVHHSRARAAYRRGHFTACPRVARWGAFAHDALGVVNSIALVVGSATRVRGGDGAVVGSVGEVTTHAWEDRGHMSERVISLPHGTSRRLSTPSLHKPVAAVAESVYCGAAGVAGRALRAGARRVSDDRAVLRRVWVRAHARVLAGVAGGAATGGGWRVHGRGGRRS